MRALYFAYGSNLSSARLRLRVASARVVGAACLRGYRLTCDKRGADGSGKANLCSDAAGRVWGAVYALDPADWPVLDACETLYTRIGVRVEARDRELTAQTYRSDALTGDPVPFAWYRRLILEGAREHDLPEDYLRALEALPSRD
jgi:gamma-glutamylcyclotransferase (GGCT)/AIG2-like uncharacterized protein YtfP